jgi:uncharacterized protein YndB with AHSA1/START domain
MTLNRSSRAVADVEGGLVLATVEIKASPERVFQALSSAEIVRWWGDSATYHAKRWSGDVRVGGQWRVEGEAADGSPYAVEGNYEAVDPPRLLVQTWKASWEASPPTRVTFRLEGIAGGTRVVVRHEGFNNRDSCASHGAGWERVLSWLTVYAEATA